MQQRGNSGRRTAVLRSCRSTFQCIYAWSIIIQPSIQGSKPVLYPAQESPSQAHPSPLRHPVSLALPQYYPSLPPPSLPHRPDPRRSSPLVSRRRTVLLLVQDVRCCFFLKLGWILLVVSIDRIGGQGEVHQLVELGDWDEKQKVD